jgi:UDP-N-acetylmuramyl pentapeptide phosphotransferase/UDP-N-acetylglucosamine-1-phosphate transferase
MSGSAGHQPSSGAAVVLGEAGTLRPHTLEAAGDRIPPHHVSVVCRDCYYAKDRSTSRCKMLEQNLARLWVVAPVVIVSFFVSLTLIVLLRPWLSRHALAHPNARSSHQAATPQGGGIAVMIAALSVAWGAILLVPGPVHEQCVQLLAVTAGMILLAAIGAIDDIWSLRAAPRLVIQCIAVGAIIAALPADLHILPHLPRWLEHSCLFVAGLWFVNLVNFMDGIDWMTVAEFVPAAGAILLLGMAGEVDLPATLLAAALLGAIAGFAPFNKPVARLFLGDVGSLPMGLLLGWLLLQLAAKGHLAAALILPLYYLADASITLMRRAAHAELFWQAHRTHFYQRAIANGFTVPQVVTRIFCANIALAALALSTFAAPALGWLALTGAAGIVAWLLTAFARGSP